MMESKVLTYSELVKIPTFEERFEYLKLDGTVADITFGGSRYLNQLLYNSAEWRAFKNAIILRDNGCDLGIADRPISKPTMSKSNRYGIYVHHLNPLTIDDLVNKSVKIFDPENVICCSFSTHQAIHYGSMSQLTPSKVPERTPFDTAPWRKESNER